MANPNEMKRFNIRMPQDMYDRIERVAHSKGVPVSAFINLKMDEILKQDEMVRAMNLMTDPVAMMNLVNSMKDMENESIQSPSDASLDAPDV